MSDAETMERVASGNRDAFAEVFDEHSSAVLALLIRMLRSRAEAEELLQDVFLAAWKQARQFDAARGNLRHWLLMRARSRALDRIRSTTSRVRREVATVSEQPQAAEPVGTGRLVAEEDRARVRGAMRQLSDDQRSCIELAFFEGLTHQEIAARLEAPLGTVKSRILYGMRKLRAHLEGDTAAEVPS